MRRIFGSLALTMGILMATQALGTEGAVAPMTYLHLYSDASGESHFKELKLSFNPVRSGGPNAHELKNKEGAILLHLKAGAVEDWHVAPRRWLLIAVKGISEVTASDGQVRRLTPGMVMLMDDTKGKGHITRALGSEDHVAIVVPIDEIPK